MQDQNPQVSMLDDYIVGAPIGSRFGISCSPAIRKDSGQKYILKKISIPQSHTQLDALLITGAYKDAASAKDYFKTQVDEIIAEVEFLQKISRIEGFVPYLNYQIDPIDDQTVGYNVHLLASYKPTLERYIKSRAVTHLDAVNLGIDMCAALSVCRREGMMYIDLKPTNIFMTSKKAFKIGDIGFAPLNSLHFFFMQEKYRSAYTAPEMQDDFASLNETIDTYSLGMILYQIFNDGKLPDDKMNLVPPVNGDEQIRRIIMKAIDPDPSKRWRDPAQLGQILVLYMQRNTINAIPIMSQEATEPQEEDSPSSEELNPPAGEPSEVSTPEVETVLTEETAANTEEVLPVPIVIDDTTSEPDLPDISYVSDDSEISAEEPGPDYNTVAEPSPSVSEPELDTGIDEVPAAEDDLFDAAMTNPLPLADSEPTRQTDLTPFISIETSTDETDLAEELPDVVIDDTAVFEEPAQDDTVFPEKPRVILADDAFVKELSEVASMLDRKGDDTPQRFVPPKRSKPVSTPSKKKKKGEKSPKTHTLNTQLLSKVFSVLLALVVLLGAGIGAYAFYQYYYLQFIDHISVDGSPDQLEVYVFTDTEESLLKVACSDPYGSTVVEPVVDGKAVFTNLTHGALYNITVQIDGLHKLKGQFTDIYTSEAYTNIVNFSAVANAEEGSVVLNMTVEGDEPEGWILSYTAPGEGTIQQNFTGHTLTVTGLSVDKDYTFTLDTSDGSSLVGQTELVYSTVKPIMAENLTVESIEDGVLTVTWNTPADVDVTSWKVHCYGGTYDETQDITENVAEFTEIDTTNAYTIEVIAEGMTNGSRITVSANPVTIVDSFIDENELDRVSISWDYKGPAPSSWVVMYTVDGSPVPTAVHTDIPFISVKPKIPGATYEFSIQTSDDAFVLGGNLTYSCPEAIAFVGHAMSSYALSAKLLPTPDNSNWNYMNISETSYTSSFKLGEDISMVLSSSSNFYLDDEDACITFVIRNSDGNALMEYSSAEVRNWAHLWSGINYHFAEIHVGKAPAEAGIYTLEMYIDNMLATTNEITVT